MPGGPLKDQAKLAWNCRAEPWGGLGRPLLATSGSAAVRATGLPRPSLHSGNCRPHGRETAPDMPTGSWWPHLGT